MIQKGSMTHKRIDLTCLFGAFVFLQFTVLALANHAGDGYLRTGQREKMYYALQVFVILGYLLHSLFAHAVSKDSCGPRTRGGSLAGRAAAYGVPSVFLVCMVIMLVSGPASLLYVAVSLTASLCLGAIGGAVHCRMSHEMGMGADVAWCMGTGSAAAVLGQYILQIKWGRTPLLPVFMAAAFLLVLCFLRQSVTGERIGEEQILENPDSIPPHRILFPIVITAILILFTCFYNEYIHHLMIRSDYGSYNVYSWPRLMFIPVYLLFAVIGSRKNGKYVPVTSLCITLIALLTVVLAGRRGTYWLTMCIFYCTIAADTCYYLLVFWRLAPNTGRPALWAPFGRILDSAMVLLTGAIHLSELPAPVVLGADIAGVVLIIVMMAVNGDFNLTGSDETAPQEAKASSGQDSPDVFALLRERYRFTPREMEVLEKLLLTEDELQPIADDLHISRRVLGRHITSIYQKTGAKSRVGLFQIYHAASQDA